MSEYQLNLHTWHVARELNFLPKHFIVSNTAITHESKQWILENLTGRFCIVSQVDTDLSEISSKLYLPKDCPAFEDPKEAILYELKFS